MAFRLLFLWWANSLLTVVAVTQLLLVALAAWAAMTLFGTKLLNWVFAGQELPERELS